MHDVWKVITDEEKIIQRILLRNGTHLSMSGDSPFARGKLAEDIGQDEEGEEVEKIIKGTFTVDKEGMDEVQALSEMAGFIKVLKVPLSAKTGKPLPEMNQNMISA